MKPHAPTDLIRSKVADAAAAGLPQEVICGLLQIDRKTLRKHYRQELDHGRHNTVSRLSARLVEKAMGGDTACLIFYLKTQGASFGFSERQAIDIAGTLKTEASLDLSRLSDEQLEQLGAVLAAAQRGPEGA